MTRHHGGQGWWGSRAVEGVAEGVYMCLCWRGQQCEDGLIEPCNPGESGCVSQLMSSPGMPAPWRRVWGGLHKHITSSLSQLRLGKQCSHPSVCVFVCVWRTDVVFVVDDRVEGDVLVIKVSLGWLHVVGALVGLDEALKLALHHRAVAQGTLLPWGDREEGLLGAHTHSHTRA